MHRQFNSARRKLLMGMAGGALASVIPLAHSADQRSLKSLAGQKGILFGSAVGAGASGTLTGSFADARYLELLKNECAVLVPENELKSYVIAAEQGKENFVPADRIADFASANGMKLRGHTLLWNRTEFTPKWLAQWLSTQSATAAERYLRDYIQHVCSHYRGSIYSWDVVNETIDPKTGAVRDTAFTRAMGFDSLRIAFEAAREHAPGAQLVYNDYMSWEAGNENHRAGVLKLLERFKRDGIPVDAFGIQSHIGNDGHIHKTQREQWIKFVDEVVGMGYSLLITEFDVNDKDLPTDIKSRDAQIATAAKEYLDVMLSYKELDQVLCWGMVDHYSWLQGFSPRPDGAPQRPTPYDKAFNAKPLRHAIAAAFESAPARSSPRS
jgi:endo-1,4-beta-xylanase